MKTFFAKIIYHSLLKTKNHFLEFLLQKIRQIFLYFTDPIITLHYRNTRLTMPFSHPIFLYQKKFPNYDMHISFITEILIKYEKINGGGGTPYD